MGRSGSPTSWASPGWSSSSTCRPWSRSSWPISGSASIEAAAILAVALNKIPNVVVTVREGARALDRGLLEMAGGVPRAARRGACATWSCPSSTPTCSVPPAPGLALIWKIVLVVELLGRSNGVGFQLGLYFQLFDVAAHPGLRAGLHRRRPAHRMGPPPAARAAPRTDGGAEPRDPAKRFPALGGARARSCSSTWRLAVEAGETWRVIGPSGCGKTTLLNIVAGLDRDFAGRLATGTGDPLAYVFQEPRLLPWRTVAANLRLVLREAADAQARIARHPGRGRPHRRGRGLCVAPLARHGAPGRHGPRLRRRALDCCCSTSPSSRSTSPPPSACASCCSSSLRGTAPRPCSSPTP